MKHIVGFSGGIDSQATARWVLNRFDPDDVILCNSNAGGNEHPLTDEFIAWYSANVHPVEMIRPRISDMWKTPGAAEARGYDGSQELDFCTLIQIKGRPPSRKAQFCTQLLKLAPQKRWMEENFGPTGRYAGESYVRYSGVRRDESEARKSAPYQQWDNYFDCDLIHPVFDWTKKMCFDYVEAHGERYNELYRLGFSRVGCAPCINSGREDIRNWAMRAPEMIDKLRQWEKTTGRTFFATMVPGKHMNTIDEVVEWAMCSRGGRQSILPVLLERPTCESKYGLCE